MDAMPALLAEVRHLRALLATPFDCGWPEPRVDRGVVPPLVLWNPFSGDDSNAMTFEPDEAKAIGAAFMRAGLAALDQKGDIK